mmetsp:Transcript_16451/g.53644  ORF Transcript_16451/g.53644 Transcript_16451/m.53644 type:complete len:944 (+) Transcript_16451:1-2832(+)
MTCARVGRNGGPQKRAPARVCPHKMALLRLATLGLSTRHLSSFEPPRSLPGLIDVLGGPEVAAQAYESDRERRQRSLQEGGDTLSRDNTNPIRFVLDFASLFPNTAQPYSTCFEVGSWYRRGFPGPNPPADGVETCQRGLDEWTIPASQGCWGKCTAGDLVTPQGRDVMIHVTQSVAEEVSNLLAIESNTGPLRFVFSDGNPATKRTMESKGYDIGQRCASDCQTTSFVAVDDYYCTSGVAGDVILSVTKPPRYQGVAGSGGACQVDSSGRPLWLVFAWLEQMSDKALAPCAPGVSCITPDDAVARWRGLVIHEILHALGFSSGKFQNARDASGARKNLLAFLPVEDTDGATDMVWHFTPDSRAYAAAQEYFGCRDAGSWNGLPLMGLPDLGRNSHWETRVMRDDVMSYGMQTAVSSITLAAMEDLGFYLANYSAVNCMSWGYQQGCGFVLSRCGTYGAGRSIRLTDDPLLASKCDGDPHWGENPDAYLNQKCQFGVDPCSRSTYAGSFNGVQCDVQCYTGTAITRSDCTYVPPGEVGSAGYGGRPPVEDHWMQWLWLAVWVAGALVVVACARTCLCPRPGSVVVLVTLSSLIGLAGLVLAGTSVYIGFFDGLFGSAVFEGLFGRPTVLGSVIAGCFVAGLSLLSLIAICANSSKLMLASYLLQILALVIELAAAALVIFYLWSLTDVSNESLGDVNGVGQGRFDGRIGEVALSEIEGVACRTYQFCCRDPRLDLVSTDNATCTVLPEGQLDVATVLQDASSPQFCEYLSGSDSDIKPPQAVCDALDWLLPDLDLQDCQDKFCTHATDGYLDFIDAIIAFMRSNAMPLGGSLAMIVLIQLIAIVNAYNLRNRYKRYAEAKRRSRMQSKQSRGSSYNGPARTESCDPARSSGSGRYSSSGLSQSGGGLMGARRTSSLGVRNSHHDRARHAHRDRTPGSTNVARC